MSRGVRTAVDDPVGQLIRSVRLRWRGRTSLVGVLHALALCALVAAVLLILDLFPGLTPTTRAVLRWLPLVVATGATIVAMRTVQGLGTNRSTALWLEEQGADPDHLLMTALEADLSSPLGRAVERRAKQRADTLSAAALVPWNVHLPLGGAAAMGLAALLLTVASPGGIEGVWHRWIDLERPASLGSPSETSVTRVGGGIDEPLAFSDLELTLTPPAYTNLPSQQAAPDAVVRALPGTAATLRVNTNSGVVEATRIGAGPLPLRLDDRSATATWRVSPSDRGVDLTLRNDTTNGADPVVRDRRVIALSVLEDHPPEVTLAEPAQDVVVATATGTVRVRARTFDDLGVGAWALHWVRSSGSGESFTFEEGEWSWGEVTQRGDTTFGVLELDLSTTDLGPGDVLHLRAEARDLNDVTGPGLGVSATRQIRVATDDQMIEVTTLVGFPIAREREPVLSQRMIILLTERLLAEADSLSAEQFQERAEGIAEEQDRLREGIEEVMFVREASPTDEHDDAAPVNPAVADDESAANASSPVQTLDLPGHAHDGSPILGVDPDLLVAFNAMWEAGRRLRQNAVANSLPPQHVALEHLQKLREADRVFARGRVERPPLDLAAARGEGDVDDARPAARSSEETAAEAPQWRGEIEAAVADLDDADPAALALRLQELAAALLSAQGATIEAASLVAGAAGQLDSGNPTAARRLLADAARTLNQTGASGRSLPVSGPRDPVEALYLERLGAADRSTADTDVMRGAGAVRPFVFATARYRSGDWDSAPLVPSNLIHSLAEYTSLPVEQEGVIVDLSSSELLGYPFVFLTGHLPLRLDDAEATNLKRYVDRGGFVFVDDHNHDIDGAFHRSVLSELARVFGTDALQPLPKSHELYRSFFMFDDGPPITGHELSGWGDGLIHEELFAIERNGRIGVLYSNKDYASEWSYHAENKRFLALDNTRFGVNILLYALTR